MMDGDEGNIGEQLRNMNNSQPKFPSVDNEERKPRSKQEMVEEARTLAKEMENESND